MNRQEILSHFKGVVDCGNGQYKAQCTAHDDSDPSLSIKFEDGKQLPLLHCFAGCKYQDIMAAAGLKSESTEKWKEVGEYVYTPTLKKVRLEKSDGSKKFVWKHKKEGSDKWELGAGGQDFPLYNQAALKAATPNTTVHIAEGEKDTDTLTKHGRLAVSSPHGAAKGDPKRKWKSEYSKALKGLTVAIIQDNDDVGADYANAVALDLCGIAESIKVIDLTNEWSDLIQGGDITDVFTMQGENPEVFDKLDKLVEDTLEFVPEEMQNVVDNERLSKSERMLRIFDGTGAYLFHDDVNEPYAAVTDARRITQIWAIEGGDFKTWLSGLFYKDTGKTIGSDALKQAISVLVARAVYNNPDPMTLSVRVAKKDSAFWYDLTNIKWQAVKITAQGWTVEGRPPILFRRYNHQVAQATPKHGGDIRKILRHINLKRNKVLFLCWLVSSFIPDIPHAMIIIHGEKGSAKTTKSSLLKMLIDPSAMEVLTLQNDSRSLAVNLQQHWLLPFDNVSYVSEETSDTLCRAITGGGIQQRKLYTDADAHIFKFKRCLAINGINNVATRADLLDRSILIELERIPEADRQELAEVLAAFEADRPEILGGIFDTLVKAMEIHPTLKLSKLPRMADFARWGYAIGEALGGYGETFLAEYAANREMQNTEAINSDPVATLIMEFMVGRDTWYGRVSELYAELVKLAPKHGMTQRTKGFPAQPNYLSRRLNGIKSNLEAVGLTFEKRGDMQGMNILIKNANAPTLAPYMVKPREYGRLKHGGTYGDKHGDEVVHGDMAQGTNSVNIRGHGDNGDYGDEIVASDDEGVKF